METLLGRDRAGLLVIAIRRGQDHQAIVDHLPVQVEAQDQYALVVPREVAHQEGLLQADRRLEGLVLEEVTRLKNEKNCTTDRSYFLFRYKSSSIGCVWLF